MCRVSLHIAHLNEMISKLDAQAEAMMVPFARQRDLLATIPGIGQVAAAAIISEIGTTPAEYFATAAPPGGGMRTSGGRWRGWPP